MSTPQKVIAFIFAALVLASFVFFAYRIHTKPSYEAHEKKQARVLAVSSLMALGDETSKNPGIWDRFRDDRFTLIFDHMKVEGNWTISISFVRREDHLEILASVNSGWNSRSPQHAEAGAVIFPDGSMSFDNSSVSSEVREIRGAAKETSDKRLSLKFPEDLKPIPVEIDVEVWSMTDTDGKRFLMLRGVRDSGTPSSGNNLTFFAYPPASIGYISRKSPSAKG